MADKTETAAFVYVAPDAAHAFAKTLIASYGVPDADAETVARCLVQADLRGVDTHGLMRLPGYLNRVRLGLTNKTPKLEAKPVGTAAAAVDGQNGFGFVVGTFAMNEAIRLAGLHGVGIVAARHSTHFGMAGSYVLQALEAGYVSMVFSNASPAMPPWGARDALLGTSPFAAGAPAGARDPFLLDMSPAVAARGKIRRALRRGQTIPEGYALDAKGRSTTDPAAALDGVVLPIGGPEGLGYLDAGGYSLRGHRRRGLRGRCRRSVQGHGSPAERRPFLFRDEAGPVRAAGPIQATHGCPGRQGAYGADGGRLYRRADARRAGKAPRSATPPWRNPV